ncbi:single-stranded-DNA-specific exonuclease RecJ [Thiobacillus sp.]|uniref:single-stranded-DNA-specific exonuclease RecJ n=1 Tax=Thiobacillus sp. TaxID=924 RepID=UPI00182DD045|nr:single-stranded-DNA-specific exonuclease RecJ [Thiobacillus sp.]MBC2732604.1 single-stranded-DNA-specific exonuclease RecJ [Thiobacillus sp.]MBC2741341.1 single-stranded-DNA-specific exonuclease RecJ [Thiobacillus sp.]MBC2759119.1 single-stranded-DNA-specific exonuclease RecJ [Thiobacillus sp.]
MPSIAIRPCPADARAALEQAGLAPAWARLYAARGVNHPDEVAHRLPQLLPPAGLLHIDRAAALLADAIRDNKRLLIIADYDADGATACAVGVRGLRLLGAQVDFIVPNRLEHGYGLTPDIVTLAAARQPDLLVTVDNGIAAVDGVAAANALGIPVLVTDHHLPGDALPDAACIVNPNQPGCSFGSKNLAGVGVMFYVLLALRAELRQRGAYADTPEPDLRALLDLVALGTVADVVKLDANNRTLVAQGLARMRAGKACAGVNALFRAAGRDPTRATVFDLGFMLGPRLNAAGRIDDMALGIECLLADDPAIAQRLAQQLDTLNRARRDVEADMLEEALAILATFNPTDSHSLTAYQPGWHIGVIGILASRLKDKFHRPTIVFASSDNGELKGSGRSIPGLHLRDALDLIDKRHPGLIVKFGGHAMAAGLSIPAGRQAEFSTAFEAVVRELIDPADLDGRIETDGELDLAEHSYELAEQFDHAVWGQGFPAPLFTATFDVVTQRVVGEKHLKLKLVRGETSFDAMRFFQADPLPDRIRAVYALMPNEFNGQQSLQLKLQHWEPAG